MENADLAEIKALLKGIRSSLDVAEQTLFVAPASDLRNAEIRLRRVRDSVFPSGYFGDAAWDILLDLDRAARSGRHYAVTDAGIDAKIPQTTTLRYLVKLERDGLVHRKPDPSDGRRAYVSLTDYGQNLMDKVFSDAAYL